MKNTSINDELNFVKTSGMFGRVRRFPTFVVEKLENGNFIAKDEHDNMRIKASSSTLEGLEKMIRPYCNYRTTGNVSF